MTTPTSATAVDSAASRVKSELTVTSDGKWTRDGQFFCPLELYAVVKQGDDGNMDFFDFLAGRWSGVVSPTTVTCNRAFAESVAAHKNAKVRVYSLVSHPAERG